MLHHLIATSHLFHPQQTKQKTVSTEEYHQTLQGLSVASVEKHFDAFKDINWDDEEFAINQNDPRWILPEVDPLGSSDWYQNLPQNEQIRLGMWRQANIFKVGLQFENILIRGIMQYVFSLENNNPEFRYLTHEATEECHHTQMFQEAVNRIGADVKGMPGWLRAISPLLPLVANRLPAVFFTGVLAGEEPIDHIQKAILRSENTYHPIMGRIMAIHVAEEARHISFAHTYLQRNVVKMGGINKFIYSLYFPLIMRILGDAILKPPAEIQKEFNIPPHVIKELYWNSTTSKQMLVETFADVHMLAEQINIINPVSKKLWKALNMWGKPSRYRSEPPVMFHKTT